MGTSFKLLCGKENMNVRWTVKFERAVFVSELHRDKTDVYKDGIHRGAVQHVMGT